MPEKIVLVTAGGHISCFHAAMMQMHETLEKKAPGRFELFGANKGLGGLLKGDIIPINYKHIEESKAGSLIRSDRKVVDTVEIVNSVRSNNIYSIIMMGGDNHLGEADRCHDVGVNIVGYPKTMDGDLSSFITLGWESAVTVGSMQTRNHHASAITNSRVFYVGLFGRNTDWVVSGVTAYGGADFGIPCEQEYDWDFIWEKVDSAVKLNKDRYGVGFAVIPYSEGARIKGMDPPPDNHCSIDAHNLPKLRPEWIGMELERLTKGMGMSACFQAHTYDMRDSPPTETDKRLSRMAGEECMNMVLEGNFGQSAVFEPEGDFFKTARAPLQDVSVQRHLRSSGYFDYDNLQVNPSFYSVYGNLFRGSLEKPPSKEDLVYKNMRND